MQKLVKKINNYDIEYMDVGQGTNTLVFAHGLGSNIDQWEDQIKYFCKDYRVIAFSLQGHGNSSKPKEAYNYTIKQYAKTTICLLKKLSIDSCIWVGNSMGGVIGYELLNNDPNFIKMLITNGTTPEITFSKRAIAFVRFLDTLLIKLLKFSGYIKLMTKHTSSIKAVQDKLYSIMINVAPHTVIATRQVLGDYSYVNTIMNSVAPIKIIKSPHDKDINKSLFKHSGKLSTCRNVEFVDLNDAGHVANLDQPQKYNELIEKLVNNM